jgi:hypothetical protein
MNHIRGADRPGTVNLSRLGEKLTAFNTELLSYVSRDKADSTARQWLTGVAPVSDDRWSVARSLAMEWLLLVPSLWGTTAVDRFARAVDGRSPKSVPPEDATALALLCRSQPRYARLSGGRFQDLAAGETRVLLPSPSWESAGDGVVFGRFATTADGCAIATGTLVHLDAEAQAIVRGFVRPGGRGLTSAAHCAEAVYRHLVRGGLSALDRKTAAPKLPFDPVRHPIDALAAAWASIDREPGPEEIAKARAVTGPQHLMHALVCVGIAQVSGLKRLAVAYRRIASVLLETMAVREAHGSGQSGLDRVAAEIDAAILRGVHPPETKTLFETLRDQARQSSGRRASGTAGGGGGDLDRLMQRIQALRAKTVDKGCTEAEALSAAEKVAELLDRHGLSMSELDLRKQTCEGIGVDTGRKRRGPVDDCMGTIALFFDCRVWSETSADGTLRYIFFGLPGDVQAAVYLHDLIAQAFASETASFQSGEIYVATHSSQRRSATNSFQLGLSRGINTKLEMLRQARASASGGSNGRALVPVKQSIIEQELERMGLTFRRANSARRKVLPGAFAAGKEAGERFEYRPGIEGG